MESNDAYPDGIEQARDPTCLENGSGKDRRRLVSRLRLVAEVDEAGVPKPLRLEDVAVVDHDGNDGRIGRPWAGILA